MSNENNNENHNVTDMTATENENTVEISAKELYELRESNADLIAEREKLMNQVSELQKQVSESQKAYSRLAGYWQTEQDKVKFILLAIQAVKLNEYLTGLDFIKKIAGA